MGSLIADLTIPPELATLLLDTNVGEPWIEAVVQFEAKLDAIKARGRVKASKDLGEVAQALGIVVRAEPRRICVTPNVWITIDWYQATRILLGAPAADTHKHEHQYASFADLGVPQIQGAFQVFAA